jgi:hypothetical protein
MHIHRAVTWLVARFLFPPYFRLHAVNFPYVKWLENVEFSLLNFCSVLFLKTTVFNTVQSGRNPPAFRKNIPPPFMAAKYAGFLLGSPFNPGYNGRMFPPKLRCISDGYKIESLISDVVKMSLCLIKHHALKMYG